MNKEIKKRFINKYYDDYEAEEFTVAQAAGQIERDIQVAIERHYLLNMVRNDISTHLGPTGDRFDRNKHTHKFANL